MFGTLAKRVHDPRAQRATAKALDAGSWRPWLRFVLHFGEMIVAMSLGMFLLAMPSGMVFSTLGYSTSDPVTAALVMTFNMTVPMVLWMRVRGHSWERSGEMGAAMVLPSILIVALAIAGVISRDGLAGTVMDPMIPAMLALMLFRRPEYAHCGAHRSESALGEELELAG